MEPGRKKGLLAAGAAGISVVITALTLTVFGPAAQGWLLTARYTARYSFALFFGAFVGPKWSRGDAPAIERAGILAFASAHGVHLAVLTTYRIVDGSVPAVSGLVVGGLGYALLALLVMLALRGPVPNGMRSGVLHYLFGVFALTYALKISSTDQHAAGIAGVVACGAALVLRHMGARVQSLNERARA